MAQFQLLGSVSTGSLRTEDLLDKFETYLEDHNIRITLPGDGISDGGDIYTMDELLTIAIEALEECCPPFVYFGTRPGDGADYGFWPDWDALDAPRPYWDAKRTIKLDQGAKVLIQFDIGCSNVTVMDLDRNVIWSTV